MSKKDWIIERIRDQIDKLSELMEEITTEENDFDGGLYDGYKQGRGFLFSLLGEYIDKKNLNGK